MNSNHDLFFSIIELLSPIFLAGIGWIGKLGGDWIKAKTKNELVGGALQRLSISVIDAVKFLNQTLVNEIKKAKADGVITPEERILIKQACVDAVKSYFGPKGLAELAKILGLSEIGVEKLIGDKIEAAVADVKKN